MSILCNPGITVRHWEQMSEIVNYDMMPNSGTTLRKVLKQNVTPYMEQFETISAAASKVRHSINWKSIIWHCHIKCFMIIASIYSAFFFSHVSQLNFKMNYLTTLSHTLR